MAFDQSNAAHLLALKTYILTTRGFDPVTVPGPVVLSAMNDPADNPTPATGGDKMTTRHLIRAVNQSNVASQDQFKIQLIVEASNSMDDDLSEFKADVTALGGQLATSLNAQVRDLSWGEVNYGADIGGVWEFITLTLDDWKAARDS